MDFGKWFWGIFSGTKVPILMPVTHTIDTSELKPCTRMTSHARGVGAPAKQPGHAYIVGKLSFSPFRRYRLIGDFRFQFVKNDAK